MSKRAYGSGELREQGNAWYGRWGFARGTEAQSQGGAEADAAHATG
jgi:hypothetical protein